MTRDKSSIKLCVLYKFEKDYTVAGYVRHFMFMAMMQLNATHVVNSFGISGKQAEGAKFRQVMNSLHSLERRLEMKPLKIV